MDIRQWFWLRWYRPGREIGETRWLPPTEWRFSWGDNYLTRWQLECRCKVTWLGTARYVVEARNFDYSENPTWKNSGSFIVGFKRYPAKYKQPLDARIKTQMDEREAERRGIKR